MVELGIRSAGLRVRAILGFAFVFAWCHSPLEAREICVSQPLTVSTVQGQIVSIPNQNKAPIPDATVRLSKCRGDDCHTIAEVTTDEGGRFHFEDIKPGKYLLEAKATAFKHYSTTVYVRKQRRAGREIIVALDAGLGCGGWAKLHKLN